MKTNGHGQMSSNICVIVAVFRPQPEHLDKLFASLAIQTQKPDKIIAVIADCTSANVARTLAEANGLSLYLVEPVDSLNSVSAFEKGLSEGLRLCSPDTVFALCDQDDIWHANKLELGTKTLQDHPECLLVHSDARLVDKTGKLIHQSMFTIERRLRRPRLRDLLYRNTVTGMTMMLRRSLVELALPFPRQSGVHFYHDLWLALLAEATGKIIFIPNALVDYRQHDGNVMGIVDRRNQFVIGGIPDMNWLRREATAYGLARFLGRSVYARVAAAGAGTGFAKGKAVQLRPYLARMRGPGAHLWDMLRFLTRGNLGLARLAVGQMSTSVGRIIWGVKHSMTTGLSDSFDQFDQRLYSLSPGVQPDPIHLDTTRSARIRQAADIIDKRKVLRWRPIFNANEPALTILVPTLNPTEVFAGIVTALDIGLGMAARGHHVRFIATDLPVASHSVSRKFILDRLREQQAASGAADRITLHCGVTETEIPSHIEDRFTATAWWSAFLCQTLISRFGYLNAQFIYVIQDYEPNFYPWGAEFADALASYEMDFLPIFNTTLLRDYFRTGGFGFACPDSLVFRPSVDVERYSAGERPARNEQRRRIALYGRPEVARNMFSTAIEVLSRFVENRALGPQNVSIVSVGLAHDPIDLGNGVKINSLGKLPYSEYPDFLLQTDIGLSLMLSPHPSHPPLEMAASGVRVVTNNFATKNLSELSAAILSAAPDATSILKVLNDAWELPSPSEAERRIDLSSLGDSLDTVLDRLSSTIKQKQTVSSGRRRVILHIGAPKCGSTYLQHVLIANQDRLAHHGIVYPLSGKDHPGNAPRLEALTKEKMLADLGDAHTLIYSHEDLLVLREHSATFARAAEQANLEVRIVCFLRPFNQLIFGTYSQTLKQNFEKFAAEGIAYNGLSFEDFCLHVYPRFRFDQFLKTWTTTFPDEKLMLRSHMEIRQTFEELLSGVELDWQINREMTNPSLRITDCEEIAQTINAGGHDIVELRASFRNAFQRIGQFDRGRSPDRVAFIESLFAESTAAMKNEFGFLLSEVTRAPSHPTNTSTDLTVIEQAVQYTGGGA